MSYTVPYGLDEQAKTTANAVNFAYRHCRIGKVQIKPGKTLSFPYEFDEAGVIRIPFKAPLSGYLPNLGVFVL